MSNKYKIDSFERLCNIANTENIERLVIDMAHWLNSYVQLMDKLRKEYPKETEGKSNTEIALTSFTWVDDGKTAVLGANIVNAATGELHEIRIKDKK